MKMGMLTAYHNVKLNISNGGALKLTAVRLTTVIEAEVT
jgi:hypothetical protein